jgi:hypothetical protein
MAEQESARFMVVKGALEWHVVDAHLAESNRGQGVVASADDEASARAIAKTLTSDDHPIPPEASTLPHKT